MKLMLAKIFGFFVNIVFSIIFSKSSSLNVVNPLIDHDSWQEYLLNNYDKTGLRILEIGSRNVTGSLFGQRFQHAQYIGFDFYDGENVDVVGDAHKLSSYFEKNSFDLVFSSAVFEHLYAPWVVANEINKILRIGGVIFVETHFSFSLHEQPWNFFHFTHYGLAALFSEALGFSVLEKGMSNPLNGLFSNKASRYLCNIPITNLYCHSQILAKKETNTDVLFSELNFEKIVGKSLYPMPKNSK